MADEHEPGLVLGVILDVGCHHLESVEVGGVRGADRGRPGRAGRCYLLGRLGGGVGHDGHRVGQLAAQPDPALAERVGVREDGLDRPQLRAGPSAEVERDREVDLPLDQQVGVESERVERDGDRALDGVLDRDEADVDVAALDRTDDVGHRPQRLELLPREIGLGEDRLLGERPVRTEEADARRHPLLPRSLRRRIPAPRALARTPSSAGES